VRDHTRQESNRCSDRPQYGGRVLGDPISIRQRAVEDHDKDYSGSSPNSRPNPPALQIRRRTFYLYFFNIGAWCVPLAVIRRYRERIVGGRNNTTLNLLALQRPHLDGLASR